MRILHKLSQKVPFVCGVFLVAVLLIMLGTEMLYRATGKVEERFLTIADFEPLEVELPEGEETGIPVSMAFICYNDDGSAYVWAENNRGKLEKRIVTVGGFNDMMGTVNITDGLSEADYIAFPDPELCQEGVPVTHEVIAAEGAVAEGGV